MRSLQEFIKELDRLFEVFNHKYFKGTLDAPMIVPQTNGRHKNTMGWCTTQKVWNEKDKQGEKQYYEITICAEYLYRPYDEICGTFLHEMVHLYNLQNGIKDTSRGGTYHNKKFKETAESMAGLVITFDKRIGWSKTTLQETTKKYLDDTVNKEAFRLSRGGSFGDTVKPPEGGEEKKKSSTRKYVCPVCGTIIRATKDLTDMIKCIPCNEVFVLEDNGEGDDGSTDDVGNNED